MEQSPRLVVDSKCSHGEGVLWCAQRQAVLWVDIHGRRLWLHRPGDGLTRHWDLPDRPGCIGLGQGNSVLLVLASALYRAEVDADAPGPLQLRHLADIEPALPGHRSNDGRADRHGNFVFGTMNENPGHAPTGAMYQYSAAHGLRRLPLGGIGIPNSICFAHDGRTLYWCDTQAGSILQAGYDPDTAQVGAPSPVVVAGAAAGSPDGSCIDAEGRIWNARWGGARVVRFAPGGGIEREIRLPVPQPSCCAFGGPGLDTLYVITSPEGLDPAALAQAPGSGGLYALELGRPLGLPESRVELPA
ncbi:SMP-30/gluconolactonase/LRE family protein [Pseudoxanthomonas sp. SGT-18]|uniref:SMP-30/gluconolactonase/LRE family protein n=1 Tax=Pseudoxanthomonas sp. SGT-18 TaxID=2493087 RepID=UPI000F62B70A|nr:SMP-30/gluconolactonase/LRE family protein [Pseudoxanthomonas sp. SGT-18]